MESDARSGEGCEISSLPVIALPSFQRQAGPGAMSADGLGACVKGGLGCDEDPCGRTLLRVAAVDLHAFTGDGRQRGDGGVRR